MQIGKPGVSIRLQKRLMSLSKARIEGGLITVAPRNWFPEGGSSRGSLWCKTLTPRSRPPPPGGDAACSARPLIDEGRGTRKVLLNCWMTAMVTGRSVASSRAVANSVSVTSAFNGSFKQFRKCVGPRGWMIINGMAFSDGKKILLNSSSNGVNCFRQSAPGKPYKG